MPSGCPTAQIWGIVERLSAVNACGGQRSGLRQSRIYPNRLCANKSAPNRGFAPHRDRLDRVPALSTKDSSKELLQALQQNVGEQRKTIELGRFGWVIWHRAGEMPVEITGELGGQPRDER